MLSQRRSARLGSTRRVTPRTAARTGPAWLAVLSTVALVIGLASAVPASAIPLLTPSDELNPPEELSLPDAAITAVGALTAKASARLVPSTFRIEVFSAFPSWPVRG